MIRKPRGTSDAKAFAKKKRTTKRKKKNVKSREREKERGSARWRRGRPIWFAVDHS